MKKITLIVAGFGLLSLASCKKDRTCTCTTTNSNGDAETSVIVLSKISSGDAKDVCSNYATTNVDGNHTTVNTRECKLD